MKNSRISEFPLVHLGGFTWCLFPWLGTRSFRALRKAIGNISSDFGISGIDYEGCYFIKFRMERGTPYEFLRCLTAELRADEGDARLLVRDSELPIFEKYDQYIPGELLRSAYAVDKLNVSEARMRIEQLLENTTF